jgi:hypothetical protein
MNYLGAMGPAILITMSGKFNGTMSADIFKRKRAHGIKLKWTFLALKWAVFCLKIASYFSKKANPANSKQNLNIMQL